MALNGEVCIVYALFAMNTPILEWSISSNYATLLMFSLWEIIMKTVCITTAAQTLFENVNHTISQVTKQTKQHGALLTLVDAYIIAHKVK